MDSNRFNRISKLFADRRVSRRQAMTAGAGAAASLAAIPLAGLAQDATPAASPQASPVPADGSTADGTYLFVQSFQSGKITENSSDAFHTLTLEHGLGQTLYFADRPSREVGVTPTKDFIKGFSFSKKNPPNAALIAEKGDTTALTVIELFEPTYDVETRTATYQVRDLDAWSDGPKLGLERSALADMTPDFDGAQLLIDDCEDDSVACVDNNNGNTNYMDDEQGFCYAWGQCMPCDPYAHNQPSNCATWDYWGGQCALSANSYACPSGDCHAYWGGGISDLLGCT